MADVKEWGNNSTISLYLGEEVKSSIIVTIVGGLIILRRLEQIGLTFHSAVLGNKTHTQHIIIP